ncbi:MAG: carboxypeptidase-like regulatory domain-containing protein, partial [Armatimonadetes bacterium]|nr:carboxypeptidase-like regulatory domain-containing protein [Armatimonadota bacterium]
CPTCRGIQPEPVDVSPAPVQAETAQPVSAVSPSLQVTALEAESGAPLQNARLIIKGPSNLDGITNNAGVFHARKLRAGGYVVTASMQGFEPASAELEMGPDAGEAVKLMLRALPSGISGRVIRRPDQQPVPGAKVYLDSSRLDRSTETGTDGCFVLDDIPAGPYTVRADADGFESQTRLAQMAPGQTMTLDFALDPAKENSDG